MAGLSARRSAAYFCLL